MQANPSTGAELFVASVYPAWSLLWALLWIKVAYHYGAAAVETWNANGTPMKQRARDVYEPLLVAVRDFMCQWHWGRRLFGIPTSDCEKDLVPTASPGNILRFAIFVASFTPITFGLAFAFVDVWRGAPWKIVLTMTFMLTSILAALGHLFLAHRGNPKRWSRIVVYTLAWILFGPLIFYGWRLFNG